MGLQSASRPRRVAVPRCGVGRYRTRTRKSDDAGPPSAGCRRTRGQQPLHVLHGARALRWRSIHRFPVLAEWNRAETPFKALCRSGAVARSMARARAGLQPLRGRRARAAPVAWTGGNEQYEGAPGRRGVGRGRRQPSRPCERRRLPATKQPTATEAIMPSSQ